MNGLKKLVDANRPAALFQLGNMFMNGDDFLSPETKNISKALKLLHCSAQLGPYVFQRQLCNERRGKS
jgi:TPR repeat protein